jgi:hypothetical protein
MMIHSTDHGVSITLAGFAIAVYWAVFGMALGASPIVNTGS